MKTSSPVKALSPAAQAIRDACDRQTAREQLRIKRDAMIASVAETVSSDWFRRCVRCPVTMSLWWRKPRAGEKAALPIIDIQQPNEDFSEGETISCAWTRDRVREAIVRAMNNLPMLSPEWFA